MTCELLRLDWLAGKVGWGSLTELHWQEIQCYRTVGDTHLEALRHSWSVPAPFHHFPLGSDAAFIRLEYLLPPDSRVEIDAKIAAGYFTSGKQITEADLVKTVGRTWEETEH